MLKALRLVANILQSSGGKGGREGKGGRVRTGKGGKGDEEG